MCVTEPEHDEIGRQCRASKKFRRSANESDEQECDDARVRGATRKGDGARSVRWRARDSTRRQRPLLRVSEYDERVDARRRRRRPKMDDRNKAADASLLALTPALLINVVCRGRAQKTHSTRSGPQRGADDGPPTNPESGRSGRRSHWQSRLVAAVSLRFVPRQYAPRECRFSHSRPMATPIVHQIDVQRVQIRATCKKHEPAVDVNEPQHVAQLPDARETQQQRNAGDEAAARPVT